MLLQSALQSVLFLFLRVRYGGMSSFPPPLSAEREKECFRLLREKGDMSARDELIEHNLRLVMHIVKNTQPPPARTTSSQSGQSGSSRRSTPSTVGRLKIRHLRREVPDERDPDVLPLSAAVLERGLALRNHRHRQGRQPAHVGRHHRDRGHHRRRPRPEDTLRESHRHHKLRPHPRERKIITLRYGLNGDAPITQRGNPPKGLKSPAPTSAV